MKEIRRRLQQGETCLGLYVRIPCPDIVELAKGAGYDFVRLDCEHALMSLSEIRELLSAARRVGMPCQIRIAPELPLTALLGQEPAGIMAPHIESRQDTQRLVDACRFAPVGRRGMDGLSRMIRMGGMKRQDYMEYEQENLDVIVQIESRAGLEHIDEILQVPGVTMAATGRADLSQELGVSGHKDDPAVLKAERYIIERTLAAGKFPTIAVNSPGRMKELYDLGVRCFLIGKDESLLTSAMAENRRAYRAAAKGTDIQVQL